MTTTPRWLAWAACAVAAWLWASEAHAQFTRGYPNYNPYKPSATPARPMGGAYLPGLPGFSNQAVIFMRLGPFGPPTVSFPSAYGRLYAPWDPRFPVNFRPPLGPTIQNMPGGYTSGGVDSSYAYGRQQAAAPAPAPVARQEAPRKAFDRWVVERERARRPDAFQPNKDEELTRALTNPSDGDVTSGAAVNTILDALAPAAARLAETPPMPVDEGFLKRINFTRGTGSVGTLRDGGKIDWPALLLNLEPKAEVARVRRQVEERFKTAFDQVNGGGKADPENARALLKLLDNLSDLASAKAHTMSFADNLQVRRFLKGLEDGVAFLKQPDAADWMPGRQKVKPTTVQELVRLMAEKGARFAPALVGNEAAYGALHRALVTLHAQVAGPGVGADRP